MQVNKKALKLLAALVVITGVSACSKVDESSRIYLNADHWVQMGVNRGDTFYEECVNDLVPGKEPKVLCRTITKTAFEDMQFQHMNKAIEASKMKEVKPAKAVTALEQLPDLKASE
mgnify:CR=1 FL=1